MPSIKNLVLEDARIAFRNFSGKPDRFNDEGDRNFCVLLDDDVATQLKEDGWNVKYLKPRDPGDIPQAYLKVAVAFEHVPPTIMLIDGGRKVSLGEGEVSMLDWADIASCDIIISPYQWTVNGNSGIKAYLKKLYVVMEEDQFSSKYADLSNEPIQEPLPF